ncbi:MAG: hypothetical protein OXB93_03760, partial [Cytophagales bacterium]|nr:hypothetical protein [Cytophagales bacterium]
KPFEKDIEKLIEIGTKAEEEGTAKFGGSYIPELGNLIKDHQSGGKTWRSVFKKAQAAGFLKEGQRDNGLFTFGYICGRLEMPLDALLKEASSGKWYPFFTVHQIETPIRNGYYRTPAGAAEDADCFWKVGATAKGDKPLLHIDELSVGEYLTRQGFRRIISPEGGVSFVQLHSGKFYTGIPRSDRSFMEAVLPQLASVVRSVWNNKNLRNVLLPSNFRDRVNRFISTPSRLISAFIAYVDVLDSSKLLRDEEGICYFSFSDGTYKVTGDSTAPIRVVEDRYINLARVCSKSEDRALPSLISCPPESMLNNLQKTALSSLFYRFFRQHQHKDDIDKNRYRSRLRTALLSYAFPLYGYKDPSYAKFLHLGDENYRGKADGGTGKSITENSYRYSRDVEEIPGEMFKKNRNEARDFRYSNVSSYTDIISLTETPDNLDIKSLYAPVTGTLRIEGKGDNSKKISFRDSPKFVLDGSPVIPGVDESTKRRKLKIGFTNFFNSSYQPSDFLDRRLFDPDDLAEWHRFFCFQMWVVHKLLENKGRVIEDPYAPREESESALLGSLTRALYRVELGKIDLEVLNQSVFDKYTKSCEDTEGFELYEPFEEAWEELAGSDVPLPDKRRLAKICREYVSEAVSFQKGVRHHISIKRVQGSGERPRVHWVNLINKVAELPKKSPDIVKNEDSCPF